MRELPSWKAIFLADVIHAHLEGHPTYRLSCRVNGKPAFVDCFVCEVNGVHQSYEQQYHEVMAALRRSRMEHGDCKSGDRYGGVPMACTACMAKIKLDELLAKYRGYPITIQELPHVH